MSKVDQAGAEADVTPLGLGAPTEPLDVAENTATGPRPRARNSATSSVGSKAACGRKKEPKAVSVHLPFADTGDVTLEGLPAQPRRCMILYFSKVTVHPPPKLGLMTGDYGGTSDGVGCPRAVASSACVR